MVIKIGNIRRPKGLKKKGVRVGRGIGSGLGKTAGRGHKGAGQRSGAGTYNPGFEGGQMPLVRRIPKRGFTNKWRTEWNIINLGNLESSKSIEDGSTVDKQFLLEKKIISKRKLPVKILGKGKLTKALVIKADAFSAKAKEAIEKAGGKVEVVKGRS